MLSTARDSSRLAHWIARVSGSRSGKLARQAGPIRTRLGPAPPVDRAARDPPGQVLAVRERRAAPQADPESAADLDRQQRAGRPRFGPGPERPAAGGSARGRLADRGHLPARLRPTLEATPGAGGRPGQGPRAVRELDVLQRQLQRRQSRGSGGDTRVPASVLSDSELPRAGVRRLDRLGLGRGGHRPPGEVRGGRRPDVRHPLSKLGDGPPARHLRGEGPAQLRVAAGPAADAGYQLAGDGGLDAARLSLRGMALTPSPLPSLGEGSGGEGFQYSVRSMRARPRMWARYSSREKRGLKPSSTARASAAPLESRSRTVQAIALACRT